MHELYITFNGTEYQAIYNPQSGYYELELTAPQVGGVYQADISYTDIFEDEYTDVLDVQVLTKQIPKLNMNKVFMWIFNYNDFSVKDIVEISDYEIVIDEETNESSIIKVLKKTTAKARDIIAVKKNAEVIYWGIVNEISNEAGKNLYEFSCKYITNIFNREIELTEENLIRTSGVETFLENAILDNFTESDDTFVNIDYIELQINSHTSKAISVTNVENGIYNLHTWMTNCTQKYDIVYSFNVVNKKLQMTIEKKTNSKELIDTKAQNISNYSEVFETDVVSKVKVLTSTNSLTLFLLSDRTTTTNQNNPNRAVGKSTTVYTENYEDAMQTALDTMKSNSYNHNISFNLYDKYIKIGTPIAIKTKESLIYDTYISSIRIKPNKFIEYQCGNIRINFLEKIMKERKK